MVRTNGSRPAQAIALFSCSVALVACHRTATSPSHGAASAAPTAVPVPPASPRLRHDARALRCASDLSALGQLPVATMLVGDPSVHDGKSPFWPPRTTDFTFGGPDAAMSERCRLAAGPDLDGDGRPDPALTCSAFCGTGGCATELYLRLPDGCLRDVGLTDNAVSIVAARPCIRHHGLCDLVLTGHLSANVHPTELLRYDGKEYATVVPSGAPAPAP